MQYLCPKHQQHILQDPELAKTLWAGAMESGVVAFQQERWQTARNFFGSAYETTLLYMWNKPVADETIFSIEHLVESGQLLSNSLKRLKIWDEAQICLLTLQNSLLHLNSISANNTRSENTDQSNQKYPSSFLTREETLNLTNNFVTTLADSLNLQSRLKCSNDLLQFERNNISNVSTKHNDKKNIRYQNTPENNPSLNDATTNGVH